VVNKDDTPSDTQENTPQIAKPKSEPKNGSKGSESKGKGAVQKAAPEREKKGEESQPKQQQTVGSVSKQPSGKKSTTSSSSASSSSAAHSSSATQKTSPKKDSPDKSESSQQPSSSASPISPPSSSSKGKAKQTEKKTTGSFFKFLLILILLAALGLAGYWVYTQRDQSAQLQQLAESHHQSMASMENALRDELREERSARQQQAAPLELITNELQLRVNSQSNRLRELSTTTRSDWLLAEAEYLMRLASQRLVTERNTKNPVALLETADQILRDIDDVDLFPVRKSLAQDITRLRMAGSVDREGLFLQLEALSQQMSKLPLLDSNPVGGLSAGSEALPEIAEVSESQSWQVRLNESFESALTQFSKLVRVRQRDNPVEPLLSPDEEIFVRHNLRLLMEQAQLSLLREEQAVFETSVNKARHWLALYFEFNDNTGVLVEQVESLANRRIVQELPDISGSLEALREYIDSWHKRHQVSEPKNSINENASVENAGEQTLPEVAQ